MGTRYAVSHAGCRRDVAPTDDGGRWPPGPPPAACSGRSPARVSARALRRAVAEPARVRVRADRVDGRPLDHVAPADGVGARVAAPLLWTRIRAWRNTGLSGAATAAGWTTGETMDVPTVVVVVVSGLLMAQITAAAISATATTAMTGANGRRMPHGAYGPWGYS